MPPKYKLIPMKFDIDTWSDKLVAAADDGRKDLAYTLGIDPSTLSGWINKHYTEAFQYPSMTAFLNACNLLDFNPRDFFILDWGAYDNEQK